MADMLEISKPNSIPPIVLMMAKKYVLYVFGNLNPAMANLFLAASKG